MIHGYVRVSTAEQAAGTSPEDQVRRINAVADILPIRPEVEIWTDLGVSGSVELANRPGGASMLARTAPGDQIVAAKLDRLFRNAEDALTQSRQWREQGIDLILFDMGTESVTTSATGRLYFGMLAQFAEFERERINERTQEGRTAKKARGGFIGGNAPFGYHAVGTGRDAIIVENPDETNLIQLAHHLISAHGNSPTLIAKKLNELGHRSRAGTPIVATQVWRWIRR